MAPKVLFILTSHSTLGNTGKPTGWYLPEFAHPYYKLEGKVDITIASPKGGEAPLDPSSVEMFKEDAEATKFLKEKESLWKNTEKLGKYLGKADEFDAIFFVGGHGRTPILHYVISCVLLTNIASNVRPRHRFRVSAADQRIL